MYSFLILGKEANIQPFLVLFAVLLARASVLCAYAHMIQQDMDINACKHEAALIWIAYCVFSPIKEKRKCMLILHKQSASARKNARTECFGSLLFDAAC